MINPSEEQISQVVALIKRKDPKVGVHVLRFIGDFRKEYVISKYKNEYAIETGNLYDSVIFKGDVRQIAKHALQLGIEISKVR